MMEELIIFSVFAIALFYLGNLVYRSFFGKNEGGCAKGCGGACSNINSKITENS